LFFALCALLLTSVFTESYDMDVEESFPDDEHDARMMLLERSAHLVGQMNEDEKSFLRSELGSSLDDVEEETEDEDEMEGVDSVAALLPGTPAIMKYQLTSYGTVLSGNKAALQSAFQSCNVVGPYQVLITAMAMLETTKMLLSQRDASKDKRTDGSANVSAFNLSRDMVSRLGVDPNTLNKDPGSLGRAACVIKKAIDTWGVAPTLNYVRGGYTAWQDGVSYGAPAYRKTIATIMSVIDKNPALLTNDKRVAVFLGHV